MMSMSFRERPGRCRNVRLRKRRGNGKAAGSILCISGEDNPVSVSALYSRITSGFVIGTYLEISYNVSGFRQGIQWDALKCFQNQTRASNRMP